MVERSEGTIVHADFAAVETRVVAERTRLFGTAKLPVLVKLKQLGCYGKTIQVSKLYLKIAAARGTHSRSAVYEAIRSLVDAGMVNRGVDHRVTLSPYGNLFVNAVAAGWQARGELPKQLDLICARDAWPSAAVRVIESLYEDLPNLTPPKD